MIALFWIKSLVLLLLVLGSLLICLVIAGVVVGGVMLIRFELTAPFRSVEVFVQSLGHFRLSRELWGVILALQSSDAVHLGVDILGVVRHVGRLLAGRRSSVPFELVHDGDLLLIDRMLHPRGPDTVRITKVEGHADEGMVLDGRVGEVDRLGNNAAEGGLVMLSLMRVVICLGFVVVGIL